MPTAPLRPPLLAVLLLTAWLLAPGALGAHRADAAATQLSDAVTDEAGVLGGQEDRVRDALAEVRDRAGVQLFVLYTQTTGGRPAPALAEEIATQNGLGGDDALLLVAFTDRSYALWLSDGLAVDDQEHQAILRDTLEPALVEGDAAGAAIATAEHLAEADAGGGGGVGDGGRSGGLGAGTVLLIAFLIGAGALWFYEWVTTRMGRRRAAEERDRRTGQLARETNRLLVASDEAVREAERELGFAEAQFRPEDVEPFRAALARAREQLHAAFAVRQRLDETEVRGSEEREALLREVIGHTRQVDTILTEAHDGLDQLRDLERNAPHVIDGLAARFEELDRRLERAEATLDELRRVAPRSTAAVEGNPVEARKRLEHARRSGAQGEEALAAGDLARAARVARDAEEALAGATELVEAVEHLSDTAAEAEQRLEIELSEAEIALAAAREAAGGSPVARDGRLAEATARLEQARAAADEGGDIVEAYRLATGAEALANGVLATIREAQEQRERERAAANAAMRAAETMLRTASDYLAPRRHGVGREARTRLEEARRHLDRARARLERQPAEAAREAETAERLAEEAYQVARDDFEDFDRLRGPFGRRPYGGGRGGGVIVIGGFPIPIGGSGRGGGGWGGSPWGSGGGRSAGGTFGGGGGRSMGGRF